LEVNRVDNRISEIKEDPVIQINEELARKSGRFITDAMVTCEVTAGYLSRFVFKETWKRRKPETGEIVITGLRYTWREEEILAAWEAAGYPLKWGFKAGFGK
jgi:hypothetical protein